MSAREHRGRVPRMSASLRHAFELLEENEPSAANRLRQISVADRDARPVVERLFDYFGNRHPSEGHPFKVAMGLALEVAGEDEDKDPDAGPLLAALRALPEGQLGTLFTMVDLACAYAAVEGMALGAAYVQADARGAGTRARMRPRR